MTVLALRPYADLDGIFLKLEYRPTSAAAFKELPLDQGNIQHTVRMDDLRIIPRHEFKVSLDPARLRPNYHKHASALRLVVLTRDSMLRREVILGTYGIDAIPDVVTLRAEDLRQTGHRDRLPLEFVIIAVPVIDGGNAVPTQRASRLAEVQVTLLNTAGGAAFPYRRKTIAEFQEKGLPSDAGVYLELFCGLEELVKESDSPPHSLFEVWLNEKVWDAIQNDGGTVSSQLRTLAVTETAATAVLATVIPAIKEGNKIEDGSVVGQLIGYLERQSGLVSGELRKQFQEELSLPALMPYVQAAFRFATIAGKHDIDDGEVG